MSAFHETDITENEIEGPWKQNDMNVQRSVLIIIMLMIISLRHFLPADETANNEFSVLDPTQSALMDIVLQIDSHMELLTDAEMKATPDQEQLITMVLDKLEMAKIICFYQQEMLKTLTEGGISRNYRQPYVERIKENLIFETAQLQLSFETIESIRPVINDQQVTEIMKESQRTVESTILLLIDARKQLESLNRS